MQVTRNSRGNLGRPPMVDGNEIRTLPETITMGVTQRVPIRRVATLEYKVKREKLSKRSARPYIFHPTFSLPSGPAEAPISYSALTPITQPTLHNWYPRHQRSTHERVFLTKPSDIPIFELHHSQGLDASSRLQVVF